MNEPNDPKLKLAIARLLPDKLFVDGNQVTWLNVEDDSVSETEWPYLLQLVEQALSNAQRIQYTDILMHDLVGNLISRGYYPGDETIDLDELTKLVFLNFNQRATAMRKVLEIEI